MEIEKSFYQSFWRQALEQETVLDVDLDRDLWTVSRGGHY